MGKHSESRLSYLFAHLPLLSSDLFSSDSSHLCFSTVHIVGSFTSKLPSIISTYTVKKRVLHYMMYYMLFFTGYWLCYTHAIYIYTHIFYRYTVKKKCFTLHYVVYLVIVYRALLVPIAKISRMSVPVSLKAMRLDSSALRDCVASNNISFVCSNILSPPN